jgi:hypothetical protein
MEDVGLDDVDLIMGQIIKRLLRAQLNVSGNIKHKDTWHSNTNVTVCIMTQR